MTESMIPDNCDELLPDLQQRDPAAWAILYSARRDPELKHARRKLIQLGLDPSLAEDAFHEGFRQTFQEIEKCVENVNGFLWQRVDWACSAIGRKLRGRGGRAREEPMPTAGPDGDPWEPEEPCEKPSPEQAEKLVAEFVQHGTVNGYPSYSPDEQRALELHDQEVTPGAAARQLGIARDEYLALLERAKEKRKLQPTEVERRAFRLRYIDGRSEEESAEILGMPLVTFKQVIRRAREKFVVLVQRSCGDSVD